MKVRVGIWHREVAVFFKTPLPGTWFIELDRENDELSIIQGGNAAIVKMAYSDQYEGISANFPWVLRSMRDNEPDGFARCAANLEVSLCKHGTNWNGHIPPNHELPWPYVRENCGLYNCAEELMKECLIRRDSARAAGIRPDAPPPGSQKRLTKEMRIALFT